MLVSSYLETDRVLAHYLCNFVVGSQVAYFSSNEKGRDFL
jgi:hypothetical protein